jgi:hypothetical protein
MIALLLSLSAFAAEPCSRAYVPGAKSGSFLEQRLAKNGVKLTRPQAWAEFVKSQDLESETKEFDQLEQDVFLRRLDELPANELARAYPDIKEEKLQNAKAKVNPCVR